MKKLLIILALCAMCICSCNTSAPLAESSAESSTEAATTEATTESTTEAEEMEKFKPTKDNVIWGENERYFTGEGYESGVLGKFTASGNTVQQPEPKWSVGMIDMYPDLEEILKSADKDDRLAVMFLSVYNEGEEVRTEGHMVLPFNEELVDESAEEYDNYINPFSHLPEGYAEQYIVTKGVANFAFMTPEEVSKLIINKNTGLVLDHISYDSFLYWMGYSNSEIESMMEE